ncbi:MAG TPA: bifunctional diguanylate cyclase/phosphodiesterase [Acidobacteriaceae bacterium]|jgi:predicted signal transduction protein with EAL and GGDEF domain|nr:bifunctional diguanylate cyclase/phosphodiesterase [Acidobacteriaceae bacterium]
MKTSTQETLEQDFRSQLQDFGLQFDSTTGLPNHSSFRASVKSMVDNAVLHGGEIALLWIDLLNLRREYSIGGDEAAERLVCAVADGLRPAIDAGELICRFSDRCFVLALKRDRRTPERLNSIIMAASHIDYCGSEGRPEIAAGAAFFPEHATTTGDLIRFASLAASAATRSRSRTPVVFRPEMNTALMLERDLERDLRAALRENRVTLAYQPQIDLITGNIIGVEGLTRWNHPKRGPVSPSQFIPVAERSDLIDEIFTHSLRRLLADAAQWRAAGLIVPSLAVNASAANVRHEDFVAIVKREMEINPPGPTQIDIEVTESLMMDDETLFGERLRALRSIGVKVSLDDFGTRYTSFNALKGLPLSSMKIDRCFVHGVDRSSQAQSICRSIMSMARHLKLGTVAEGIETAGELRALKKMGCQSGQGYLFQRPIPSERLIEFLLDWPEQKRGPVFADAFLDVDVDPLYEVDPLFGVV